MPDGAPQPKEREEYRVECDGKRVPRLIVGGCPLSLHGALTIAADRRAKGWKNVRIQRRTVTESPWVDIEDDR